MPKEPVTIIDRDVLKVLSTDTRMDILKLLKEGERTPSFVAKKLGKSDATIVEHLQTMMDVGLVKKTSAPGKKWVFYSLTEKGEGIASSKTKNLVIILSTSLLAFGLGVGSMVGYLYNSSPMRSAALPLMETTADTAQTFGKSASAFPPFMVMSGSLIAFSVLGLSYYLYLKTKYGRM